eukprot:364453-Chlamydomonas_euryale.AAC.4
MQTLKQARSIQETKSHGQARAQGVATDCWKPGLSNVLNPPKHRASGVRVVWMVPSFYCRCTWRGLHVHYISGTHSGADFGVKAATILFIFGAAVWNR